MNGLNATIPEDVRAQANVEVYELRTTFYVGLASYTVLLYDHFLTLGDEVKYIWMKRKRSPLVWLFFLNRYLTPLAFIGNLYAYFSNTLDYDKCKHFVRYEGATTVIGINIASLMMLLRVYAMYEKRKAIVAFVALVLALELGTNAWLLTNGIAVHHTPHIKGYQACTMIFDTSKVKGVAASASAWTPLVFDTLVLGLTMYRTYSGIRKPTVGRTMWILLKEGVMYYSVIFCVTLVLTLMIVFAPPGIQNLCAQMEYLLTVAMMSRITLHLKRAAHKQDSLGSTYDLSSSSMMISSGRPGSPIAFAPRLPTGHSLNTAFNISIQSQTVMHDDHGEELSDMPRRKTSLPHAPGLAHVVTPPRTTRRPGTAGHGPGEWYEFAPLRFQADRERELERDRKVRLDRDDV
ncbi:hypothetical protein BD309DRAFT_884159 [Dichomitus squalens]|nr:hypothetical protein BD309DRAFT_884159 [Dichomitus squalens]